MKASSTITFLVLLLSLFACNSNKEIVKEKDYQAFLSDSIQTHKVQLNTAELNFWKTKLKTDTGSMVYLQQIAYALQASFACSGYAEVLPMADSLLILASSKTNHTDANIFYALAQNAISQHKFTGAQGWVFAAAEKSGNAYTNSMLGFDVAMELGEYKAAERKLALLSKDTANFDYIIRAAKFEDYKGNTKESIRLMECAYNKVKRNNKVGITSWVRTNLADMYSHNGELENAYTMYLEALKVDGTNLYALKGIAQIALKHDLQPLKAKAIFSFIQKHYAMPDVLLDLAAVELALGNKEKADALEGNFAQIVQENKSYGNMYNKYLISLFCNNLKRPKEALALAEKEIGNRKTPETYSWLALAQLKNNSKLLAQSTFEQFVMDKTAEPEPLLIGFQIYKGNNAAKTEAFRKACLESAFELGPDNMAIIYNN